MAWLKHNYKYRNIDKKSITSDMSARVLRESMPRILKQEAEEEERAFKTRKLMDQTFIICGPSIYVPKHKEQEQVNEEQKTENTSNNPEINPEDIEMQ